MARRTAKRREQVILCGVEAHWGGLRAVAVLERAHLATRSDRVSFIAVASESPCGARFVLTVHFPELLNGFLAPIHIMAYEELLEDPVIQKYLHELVGPTGMPVAAAPPDGEVTDEELAEELGLELNDVRRALFILYENDLATYRRLRDEDSGWLTYLWTFEYDNIPEKLEEEMHRLLDALIERREYELNNEFYLCETDSIRFEFGEAMDFGFECPNCGSQLVDIDNARLVDAIDERIADLRDELNRPPEPEAEV